MSEFEEEEHFWIGGGEYETGEESFLEDEEEISYESSPLPEFEVGYSRVEFGLPISRVQKF